MSWKTTLCGVLSLIASGISLVALPLLDNDPGTAANLGGFGAAIAAAIGLYFARDHDNSSEDGYDSASGGIADNATTTGESSPTPSGR